MIRIIVDKIDGEYIVDVLDTRNGSDSVSRRKESPEEAIFATCLALERWKNSEKVKA